jgi:hypothetical protein
MRITVGGLLICLGAGAVATVAFLPSGMAPQGVENYIKLAREKVNTSLGLFRSASSETNSDSPLISTTTTQEVQPAVPVTPPVAAAPAETVIATAAVTTSVETVKPAVKKAARRRRVRKKPASASTGKTLSAVSRASKTARATAAAASVAPVKSPEEVAKANRGGSLIGKDVILTLNTGREVRGVLQEQDSIAYKVELPGLGVFTYPLQNVKSLRPAQ